MVRAFQFLTYNHAQDKTSKRSSVCAKPPRRAQRQENLRKFCKGVKVQILHWHKYSDSLLWNLRTWFSPVFFKMFLVPSWWIQLPRHDSLCLVANSIKEKKQQKKQNEVETTAPGAQGLSVWRHASAGGSSLLHSRADSPQLWTEFNLTEPECKNLRRLQRINHHCTTFCLDRSLVSEGQGWRNTSRLNTQPTLNRSVHSKRPWVDQQRPHSNLIKNL